VITALNVSNWATHKYGLWQSEFQSMKENSSYSWKIHLKSDWLQYILILEIICFYITLYWTTFILHYTGSDNYFTLYWTRQLFYIILDQTITLHYTGPDNYFTLYWIRQLLYIILDQTIIVHYCNFISTLILSLDIKQKH
jgi:hypothetical protein